jgi:type VI secretion system VgrG family protein
MSTHEGIADGSYDTVVFDTGTDLKFAFEAEAAPEAFRVLGFEGEEALFECFELAIELVSHDFDLDLHALLDTPATLAILHAHAEPRHIHGVISEIERRGSGFDRTFYRVVLMPALHRLRYHSDSRIFQQQSVPDISKLILAEQGIDEVRWQLMHQHLKREYCICYQESSYDFLRRLWAEEGIFFWFEHDAERHTLVLADDRHASPLLPAAPHIAFNATPGGAATGFWVSRFDQTERLRATERMARDYCFKRPSYNQEHLAAQQADNGAKASYQLYQYPGRHKQSATGKPFNRHALAAHRLDATTARRREQQHPPRRRPRVQAARAPRRQPPTPAIACCGCGTAPARAPRLKNRPPPTAPPATRPSSPPSPPSSTTTPSTPTRARASTARRSPSSPAPRARRSTATSTVG